jgi:hypothetical protein
VSNPQSDTPSHGQLQTVFQKAAGEVLAQRIEGLALELRGISNSEAGTLASNETLSVLAMTLGMILKKIDEIFEFDGFVFTPACFILLELFQARARGSVFSVAALCEPLSCSASVGRRWVDVLESWHLVEKLHNSSDEPKVILTEKGYLRTAQALQLLL